MPRDFDHHHLLPETVVSAARPLVASGLTVEERRHPAAEIDSPGALSHLIVLQLGASFDAVGGVDGESAGRRRMRAGDLSLLPAGRPAAIAWNKPTHVLHIELRPTFLARIVEEAGFGSGAPLELTPGLQLRDPALETPVRLLGEELRTGGLGTRLYADALAQALAVNLLRRHSAVVAPPPSEPRGLSESALRRAKDFVQDNFGAAISVEDIAAAAGLSPFHFTRLFRQSTGAPPHQYLLQTRVERAKALLRAEPDLSLAQVAAAVGFFDQSHFNRHFKRLEGVTPAEFRRR